VSVVLSALGGPSSRLLMVPAAGLLAIGLGSPAVIAKPSGNTTGLNVPAAGVVCDQAGPVCYDAQGPSIGHTQTYFGRIAAERLTRQLAQSDSTSTFRLGNGTVCDTRASLCWSDGVSRRVVNQQVSQKLFGSSGGGSNSSDVGSPAKGVLCDAKAQLCYDRKGLSLGLTREYYGSFAEQKAIRQLNGQTPPPVFQLSTGAVCDVGAERCWSDGWNRRQVDERLSGKLFTSGSGGGSGTLARQAQCRLSRWFQVLASGICEISERTSAQGRKVAVSLANGSTYTFSNRRDEGYRITDEKGNRWPVRVSEQGSDLSFSWTDRTLLVTPQRTPGSTSQSLIQLLDALLSN
jgi:uncharacterized protein (DUF779 family)